MQTNKFIANNKKPIGWFLVLSILLITVLPAHYHLHHLHAEERHSAVAFDDRAHEHSVGLHLSSDGSENVHHDEAVEIEATPDGVVKKIAKMIPFIALVILVALVPVAIFQIYARHYSKQSKLDTDYLYFSPLLRAPPLN